MAKNRSPISVICDAGPIIHLDEIGHLYLMKDFEKVLVPVGVRQEVLKHRAITFRDHNMRCIDVSDQYPLEEPLRTMCRIFSLDAGKWKL